MLRQIYILNKTINIIDSLSRNIKFSIKTSTFFNHSIKQIRIYIWKNYIIHPRKLFSPFSSFSRPITKRNRFKYIFSSNSSNNTSNTINLPLTYKTFLSKRFIIFKNFSKHWKNKSITCSIILWKISI